ISTFNSVTIHCARCHDHKFDPITQRDYYRLQAVFAGVERGDRPYKDLATAAKRADLEKKYADAAARQAGLEKQASALTSPELAALETRLKTLQASLSAVPKPPTKPSPSNGYHSEISANQEVVKWVQVDLGK